MKNIKNLKIWLSIVMCIILIMSAVSLFVNNKYMSVYAEENIEETETTEFETLEKQILKSERWCNASDDKIGVYLDIENMWFLPNEDIVVSYLASNEQEITDFDYEATGFEVVDIEIDEENSCRITTELNCLPNEDEYILNIPITIGGEDTSVSLYAINNNYGTFVSQFSTANAYERYLEYAVTENIVTLEQAEKMWYAFLESDDENALNEDEISMENIDSVVAPASMGRGTVCGYLKWQETDKDMHPLSGIKVEIYYTSESLGVDIKLATTYTDDDGYYQTDIDAHNNVYIKIYAGDGNIMVGSGIFGWPYSLKFDDDKYNVSAGDTVNIRTRVVTMKHNETIDDEVKHAFQIGQAAIAAREYADDMMDQNVTGVTIIYPSLPAIGTCYTPVLSCIAIDGISDIQKGLYSYEAWDVIMHEYGHHIEFLLNIMMDPLKSHDTCLALSDTYDSVDKGTRMAWGESWNTVFGLMAQDYLITQERLDNNIETVGDTKFNNFGGYGFDLESDATSFNQYIDYSSWKSERLGDSCEESVMAVLWDLYDTVGEEKTYVGIGTIANSHADNISLTHEEYWNLTTVSGTYRFSDIANRFYDLYADEPEKIKAFAEILTYYEMAPSCPNVYNASTVSITEAPELRWSPQGGSVNYPNNSFNIVVYDSSYNKILTVENVEDTEYIFDDVVWEQALKNHGYPCVESITLYITIAGSRKEPLFLDPDFSTGPYYSAYKSINFSIPHNFIYDSVNNIKHVVSCFNCDYREEFEHNLVYESFDDFTHGEHCADCDYVDDTRPHKFVYTPVVGNRHKKSCSCGYSATESCMGRASIDGTSYCISCRQEIISIPPIIMSIDDEEDALPYNKEDEDYTE